jgi:hypothetical protein
MTETLVQIIFGWPAIITSILLSVVGVPLKKPALLVAAGVVCIPFTYYISGGFHTPAIDPCLGGACFCRFDPIDNS